MLNILAVLYTKEFGDVEIIGFTELRSQPLPATFTHYHSFFKKKKQLSTFFQEKRPTPTHFSRKKAHSNTFLTKATHSHPFF